MTAIWFLPGAIPEPTPKLPRRLLAALLAGAALAAGGAVAFYVPQGRPAAVQRPGPRRYPPAYHP
jgi:hypothetical protein